MHIFLPQNIKIEKIAEKLNNVEPSMNFTYEKKKKIKQYHTSPGHANLFVRFFV